MADRTRRANGTGSITSRDDGALIVRVTHPETGVRHKRIVKRGVQDDGRSETPAQHRKRAEIALTGLRADLLRPASLREQWTVEQYARDRYLPSLAESTKPNTRRSYRKELELYVFPYVGAISLAALTADDIDQLDRTLLQAEYSQTVRRKARGGVGRVLRHAVRKRRIDHDVSQYADKIARDDRDRTKGSLEPEQVRALLAEAAGTEWAAAFAVLGLLGPRRGELLGLSWQSVDFDSQTVRFERSMSVDDDGRPRLDTPKNRQSCRTLGMTSEVATVLRAQRARQAEQRLAAGEFWTSTMTDTAGDVVSMVFTDETGRVLPAHRVNSALRRLADRAGVSARVTPHVLRHSTASLMIAERPDIAAVSAVLGHASPAVTSSVYAHALNRTKTRATTAIADAIGPWLDPASTDETTSSLLTGRSLGLGTNAGDQSAH